MLFRNITEDAISLNTILSIYRLVYLVGMRHNYPTGELPDNDEARNII